MENRKKKCGIVTFHSSHNYGSVLQAYAMVRVMQKMGLDAELIDFRHPRTTDMYEWRLWSTYKNWKWNLRELVLRGLFSFGKKREQVFSDFIENVLKKSKRVKDKNDIPDIYVNSHTLRVPVRSDLVMKILNCLKSICKT